MPARYFNMTLQRTSAGVMRYAGVVLDGYEIVVNYWWVPVRYLFVILLRAFSVFVRGDRVALD